MVGTLASHHCGPGSIPGVDAKSGLSFLLVLVPVSRVFLQVLQFSFLPKTNNPKLQFDLVTADERATLWKPLKFPLFIYFILYYFISFYFIVVFFFFVYYLQDEKKVHIVAVGYGSRARPINRQVLEEIGGDNVLVMQRDSSSGYASYAKQIKDMVCGKFNFMVS